MRPKDSPPVLLNRLKAFSCVSLFLSFSCLIQFLTTMSPCFSNPKRLSYHRVNDETRCNLGKCSFTRNGRADEKVWKNLFQKHVWTNVQNRILNFARFSIIILNDSWNDEKSDMYEFLLIEKFRKNWYKCDVFL